MRLRDTIICSVCIVLSAALLIIAGMKLDFINSQRQEMKLIINEPLENAPPSLAFATVAMGAFRGLVVDVLWLRADRLKEQGQFFDAKQLAEWITALQPRFASVWEFHAWNMAYNISVAIPATQPQERWRWVKNGYELLRDQGIELNPKSILLYRELAGIFQFKIGGVSDDAHKYYKLQLAMAMEPLLGPADNQTFQALAEAPTDWQQIVKDANVAPLITALKSADKEFSDDDKFVSNYLSLRQTPERFDPKAFKVIDNFRGTEALEKFDIFAKACQLRRTWKLDPVFMHELNQLYGPVDWDDPNEHLPLDWRHPDSHALYWGAKGLQTAGEKEWSVAEANTDRIVSHSLQSLFRSGKVFIYKSARSVPEGTSDSTSQGPAISHEIFLRPDLRMFEPYNKSVLATLEKYKDLRESTYNSMQIGHRKMLINAVFSFYQAGHRKYADEIYSQLKKLYPRDEFKVSLANFVRNRLAEEFKTIGLKNATESIVLMLREAYFRYAIRDDDAAAGLEKMAQQAHRIYRKEYWDDDIGRVTLPDFKLLRYVALDDFFKDGQYPSDLRRNLIGRIKIERPELFEQLERQREEMFKKLEQSE